MKSLTIITPTTGKDSLFNLINSIKKTDFNGEIIHYLLWDNLKQGKFNQGLKPSDLDECFLQGHLQYTVKSIDFNERIVQEGAPGSSLRAVGLMAANSTHVTFADDDVTWEPQHVLNLFSTVENTKWGIVRRNIWKETEEGYEYLGVDNFESVGEKAKTPYKMADNNCMIFERRYGTSAAVLYRETKEYNDDRLMYDFLKKHAGPYGESTVATINQICPQKLNKFFEENCTLPSED